MGIKVLMLSKKNNIFCNYAEVILKSYFNEELIVSVRGEVGSDLPSEVYYYSPEYIISFLSPWIIPHDLLKTVQKAAINFHPGSPKYPGTGCYNFALYEQAKEYGITCHHMKEKVDTGDIIMTSYFEISPEETVESLKLKSMNHMLFCFEKIINKIYNTKDLPISKEKWLRKAFTRKQLEELCYIEPDCIDKKEVALKVKSTYYPGMQGAFTIIGEEKFYIPFENRKPIV